MALRVRREWRNRDLRLLRFRSSQRSEEHTSELQSHSDLVCRLLLEKKKRGDMSSSGLLLRCARSREELPYVPVQGAVRHGPHPQRLTPINGIFNVEGYKQGHTLAHR